LPPDTGWIQIGDIPAYRVTPEGTGPFPVVLVVQEMFGVTPHLQDICRRFTARGYLAIAPEFHARQGDVSGMKDHNEIRKIVAQVPDAQVLSDLDAAVAWLYAAHSGKLKAAAAWYDRVERPLNPLRPQSPIDVAGELRCPLLGLYGGLDAGTPVERVERMRAAARSSAEIVIYPEPDTAASPTTGPVTNPKPCKTAGIAF
jgi:carboxymethylenebutenolidase